MEIFWSDDFAGGVCVLNEDESAHCVRVLRHRPGDEICVIDGRGTMYRCIMEDASPKEARCRVVGENPGWGSHPYNLEMAVCPTKNIDRYEWFIEKATEIGVDRLIPVIGERSERKAVKPERLNRILLSAAKQSLKSAIPVLSEAVQVSEYIKNAPKTRLRLIACCFEDGAPRVSIREAIGSCGKNDISILIGPEGDFSPDELRLARDEGWIPVHLGSSRLRTETAAVVAVTQTYSNF